MTPDRSQRCTHPDDEWCDDCFIPARHTRTLTALDEQSRTDPTTAAMFGIPDAEYLESDLAAAYEAQVEPFRDAHDLSWAEIEEWSTHPPRSHLPGADWIIETTREFPADIELDEHAADAIDEAGASDDVRAAFQAALDLWASKITYRMTDKLLRTWEITWDDNGQPLADGQPIYVAHEVKPS